MKKTNLLIYGTLSDTKALERLSNVSITGSPTSIRALGLFFLQCAAEMEAFDAWDHSHFIDSSHMKHRRGDADVICMFDKVGDTR